MAGGRKTLLKTELEAFKNAANNGCKIAKSQHKKLCETLKTAKKNVDEVLGIFENSKYMDSSVTDSLANQLVEISKSFDELEIKTGEDISNLRKSLSLFSITLFGRTMAGKSTLMEFLTHGKGDSIGKGAQRTTRDVRTYVWNKLSITDVPGIGAFEGEEDETIAFTAAKNGDVILFLITDDAPQSVEAECFSKIVNLGKPIIVILNIKTAIVETESVKLILRDIEKKFDVKRIENLKKQFRSFAIHFGQNWNHIPIIPVHLHAAYKSLSTSDEEIQSQLYEISRVDFLQKEIISSVKQKGEFYRIKTFVDVIDNPMISSMETLLAQSNKNSSQARVVLGKKRNLEAWKEKFRGDSLSKIESFVSTLKSNLFGEIASFSEGHYNDKNAGEAWKNVLSSYDIEQKATQLLRKIESKCNDHLFDIAREISNELAFSNHVVSDKSINMTPIIDTKRIWNWATLSVSSGLAIAAVISGLCGAACAGPLGWAALIVTGIGTLFSFLLSDKNKKINDARQNLEHKLRNHIDGVCKNTEKTLLKCLNEIEKKRIENLCKEIQRILNVMFSLSDEQRKLAWDINHQILDINRDIVKAALKLVGYDGRQYRIKTVSRIPGQAILLELPDGTIFPEDGKEKIQKLMGEQVSFVFESDNKWVLLSRILGKKVERTNIKIEENIGVAHVPVDKKNLFLVNRVRLAQQLTELLITK